MPIDVTESITRKCCQPNDLKEYKGLTSIDTKWKLKFCIYCGQVSVLAREYDGVETASVRVPINLKE